MTPFNRRRFTDPTNESGQTMAEYSVLVAVIALVVIATLPQLATPIKAFFTTAAGAIAG